MDKRVLSRKFSPNAKQIITTVSPKEKRPVKIIMRISGDLNAQRQLRLQALGCQIHSVAGDVVSADVPAGALRKAGELDFISFVEISQPLYPEAKANQK